MENLLYWTFCRLYALVSLINYGLPAAFGKLPIDFSLFFICNSHVTISLILDQSLAFYVTKTGDFWWLILPDLTNWLFATWNAFSRRPLKRPKYRHWYRFQSFSKIRMLFLAISTPFCCIGFFIFPFWYKCTYKKHPLRLGCLIFFWLYFLMFFMFF